MEEKLGLFVFVLNISFPFWLVAFAISRKTIFMSIHSS